MRVLLRKYEEIKENLHNPVFMRTFITKIRPKTVIECFTLQRLVVNELFDLRARAGS